MRADRGQLITACGTGKTLTALFINEKLAADRPPAPPTFRNALRTIDTHVAHYIDAARLPLKAA